MTAIPDGEADTLCAGASETSPKGAGEPVLEGVTAAGGCGSTLGTEADGFAVPALPVSGQRIGEFTLLQRLGEGGMGVVFAAWSHKLARKVALKLPTRGLTDEVRARIVREAQSLAQVDHPNVVQIFEIGEQGGLLFIAMELVEGVTLRAWQSDAARGWRELVYMYLQAGRGLAAAHRQGLIHRDFKPSNTLVDREGRVRLIDFGLARMRDTSRDLAPTVEEHTSGPEFVLSSRCGTPRYMAPELYETGATVDARSDQYSFCVALWEALLGELPDFRRTIPADAPRKLPGWLVRALRRGLAERREDRYLAMDDLLADLGRGLAPPRRPLAAAVVAGALAAATGAAVAAVQSASSCPAPAALAAELWPAEARAAVQQSVPEAMPVETWFSAQVEAWADASAAVCRGDAGPARASAELCLGERRRALGDVAATIAAGAAAGWDAARWDARLALWDRALAPAADCTDPRRLAQAPAAPAAFDLSEVTWLEDRLHAGAARVRAGDPDGAEVPLQQARAAATALGDPWRRAEAELQLGIAALGRGDDRSARARFEAASGDAEAAGDDFLAADAWRWLTFVAARSADPDDALQLLPHAEAKLRRIDQAGGPRMVDLQLSAAWAELRAGDPDSAHGRLARALARTSGVDEALAPRVLRHHAEQAHQRGQHAAAVDLARQALALQLRREGESARAVADTRQSLARYQLAAGLAAEAEDQLRAALASPAFDGDPRERASSHLHLATIFYSRGDLDAAAAAAEQAERHFAAVADKAAARAERVALAKLRGDLSLEAGAPTAALRRYAAAEALAGDLPELRDNLLTIAAASASAHHRLGDLARADATISAALRDLTDADPTTIAFVLGTAAEIDLALARTDRAAARCHQALATVPPADPLASGIAELCTQIERSKK